MPVRGKDARWLRSQLKYFPGLDVDRKPLEPLPYTFLAPSSSEEDDQAALLLTQASEERRNGEIKTFTAPTKSKQDKWAYEDYATVLKDVVGSESIPGGVIKSVLDHLTNQQPKLARKNSLSFRKSVTDNERSSLMGSLVMEALTSNQLDHLQIVAHYACQTVVSSVIRAAVFTNNIQGLEVLLKEKADPNTCPAAFHECISTGKLDCAQILLRSQVPISDTITTQALPTAVNNGDIGMIQQLLAHGANADFQNGMALKIAINNERVDIVLCLLLCESPPTSKTLGSMVLYLWSHFQFFSERQLKGRIIEILLNGGAAGKDVDAVLLGAVKQRWGELVQLLMYKGTSIASCDGEAYKEAVHVIDYDMLEILNGGSLGKELASEIFNSIDETKHGEKISFEDWKKLASGLLRQGAVGNVVHEALITRIHQRDLDGVKLLLKHGASGDYNDGHALKLAVLIEELDYLNQLLDKKPNIKAVSAAFAHVSTISHLSRLRIARSLLKAGATGDHVEKALDVAIDIPAAERDHKYIAALVDGGANVGQKNGSVFRTTVKDADQTTLEILLAGKFTVDVLMTCIPVAMHLEGEERHKILEILLDNGAKGGPTIDQALVDSIDDRYNSSIHVAELLLKEGAARTDFNEGAAFKKAIFSPNLEFLKLLVQFNHLEELAFCSCLSMIIDLPRDDQRLFKMKRFLTISVKISDGSWVASLKHEMQCMKEQKKKGLAAIKLLLHAGVDVNFDYASVVSYAIEMEQFDCFKLYLGCQLSAPSIQAVFASALTYTITTTDLRYLEEILKLENEGTVLNSALAIATQGGERLKDTCQLLLQHHASPSFDMGTPLRNAIQAESFGISILELLLQFEPSEEAIAASLSCAFHALRGQERLAMFNLLLRSAKPQTTLDELLLNTTRENPCDHSLLKSLLRAGASIAHQDGDCILQAAYQSDMKSLKILHPYCSNQPAIASKVFEKAWINRARVSFRGDFFPFLLDAGATGGFLSAVLRDAVEESDFTPTSLRFMVRLLDAGADVNYDNGYVLTKAASKGNISLLSECLAHQPHPDNVNMAFTNAISSGLDPTSMHDVAVVFFSHEHQPIFSQINQSILFLLLQNYPSEKDLVDFMIAEGCPVDPPVETGNGNYLSLLHWVLLEGLDISDEIIDTLLQAGANPNLKSKLGLTPLELAISLPRRQAVSLLLRHGADASAKPGTAWSQSMLSLAVTVGDSEIVRMVMSSASFVRDGALHEAAREVNTEIIGILISEGGQKDYGYSACNGRTALAELCLKADGNKPEHDLRRAMTLLKNTRNVRAVCNGRSALHLALDNPQNSPAVTRALLDSCMGEYINEDFNLYENGGLVYSPVAYVKQHRNKALSIHDDALLQLLSQFGCKNRFWAKDGHPQPTGVINPPDDIAKSIRNKKNHEMMIENIRTQSDAAQLSISNRHELILKNEQKAAEKRAEMDEKAQKVHLSMSAKRHEAEIAQMTQMSQQIFNQPWCAYNNSDSSGFLEKYAKFDRDRRRAEQEHLKEQQRLITKAYKERADIEKKAREANALEMRRLRELWYEIDPWD